jgi:AcrR family transcriptional regulator
MLRRYRPEVKKREMSRKTLPQQRALETRRRILDAARAVFAARGFAAATVDDVVAAAEVSKGALYHHFDSKEELFLALLGHRDAPVIESLAGKAQAAKSFKEILTLVVHEWLTHYTGDRFAALSLEFRLQATRDSRFAERMARFTDALRSMLAGLVAAGQRDGAVPQEVDPAGAAAVLFGLLDGVSLGWSVDPTSFDPSAIVDDVADAVERVLAARDVDGPESSKYFLLQCAREAEAASRVAISRR